MAKLFLVVLITVLATARTTDIEIGTRGNREAVLKEDLFRMRDAIQQFHSDNNRYPPTLQTLVSHGYLRDIPKDPMTNSADSWLTIPATAPLGVMNVKSGSGAVATDGSRYADWE
jgi:general secretion pathway protein G